MLGWLFSKIGSKLLGGAISKIANPISIAQEVRKAGVSGFYKVALAESSGNWWQRSWRPLIPWQWVIIVVGIDMVLRLLMDWCGIYMPPLHYPPYYHEFSISHMGGYGTLRGIEKIVRFKAKRKTKADKKAASRKKRGK